MTSDITVVGFTGKMGSGKDAAGEYLVETYGFERIGFADGLREEVNNALLIGRPKDAIEAMSDDVKAAWTYVQPSQVYKKPTTADMRTILQWWGTEFRRAQDVFTDVRFANEAALIHKYVGDLILLTGRETANEGIQGHASEDLPEEHVDFVLDNSGSIEELHRGIEYLVDPGA
jgi:hypothetical protein